MTICLVTDRRQLSPDARTQRDEVFALGRWLEDAIAAGIDLIQLREGDLPARLMAELAGIVAANASGSRTRVVVNDRTDVAIASDCHGVHLRSDGPPIARVREFATNGRDLLIGRSVHSVDEARAHASADYLIFGAVFDSGAKRGLGLTTLRDVVTHLAPETRERHSPQVIAIGGITAERATACIEAGASGVAAIRLFLPPGRADGAIGVWQATRALRAAFDAAAMRHLQ